MFDQMFLSPNVKRSAIISNKHGIYEIPHELPNDLRNLQIRKYQQILKTLYNYSPVLSISLKIKILSILAKKFLKKRN